MQKFENIDIIESLKTIMQTRACYSQTDLDITEETLKNAAKSDSLKKQIFLWLCHAMGTSILTEHDTFIKYSKDYELFCGYARMAKGKTSAYAIEFTGSKNEILIGNLYELNCMAQYARVQKYAVEPGHTTLVYEHGEIQNSSNADQDLGKFLYFKEYPDDPNILQRVLLEEKKNRDSFLAGNITEHITALSRKMGQHIQGAT